MPTKIRAWRRVLAIAVLSLAAISVFALTSQTISIFTLTSQTITGFSPATPIVFSTGKTFTLSATGGGSGNPVVFASTTTTICTVSVTVRPNLAELPARA
jgi:hypothetical protein